MVFRRSENVKKPLEGVPVLILVQNSSGKGVNCLCQIFERKRHEKQKVWVALGTPRGPNMNSKKFKNV